MKPIPRVPAKIVYDYETDIFTADPLGRKDYDVSVDCEGIILDFDKKKRMNGIEILNASRLFRIPKMVLKHMMDSQVAISVSKDRIELVITIKSRYRNAEKLGTVTVERVSPEHMESSAMNLAMA
ncbi:MAG: hypothetical protein A3B06_03915 [Candidatus Yonathbacteria bacterium RIFCSPLOWO2_01_FULL_43_20]|nr:MAG: hypothetical protein A3B06_03915 [Candidatus Yonathbacteria bacterium RIFCSPLOWO2_01_FULL_43_20]HKZ42805.1 DUF2283 domain-containing protein [Candidatus Hodarchaeales archaeon]